VEERKKMRTDRHTTLSLSLLHTHTHNTLSLSLSLSLTHTHTHSGGASTHAALYSLNPHTCAYIICVVCSDLHDLQIHTHACFGWHTPSKLYRAYARIFVLI
jgi:hypothetical protein